MPAQQGGRRRQIDCRMQAQWGQRGLHDKGTNSSAPKVTMPVWQRRWHQRNSTNTPACLGQQCRCNNGDNAHATCGQRGQRNKDNDAGTTRVTIPMQCWQWHQRYKGNDAIVIMAKTPANWRWGWLLQAVLWYSGHVYKGMVQRSVRSRYIDTNVCAKR